LDLWQRALPECITLDVRPGVAPSDKPPVRIFLGTEASQFRPERVLVWSVEQVRDPSRVYEIHLMKELTGFDRRSWTTGFTNYRFAIPHFAGGRGRAIYNDEDQIYLTDPAELFDLEMGEHGFLAIAPSESSVMLIDCERMAPVWPLEEVKHGSKKAILRRSLATPGVWGPLDGGWNARDGEYLEGRSHLLHYTTLHTQPWRPFPERFVYDENPLGSLWHDLERGADEAGFFLFDRSRPSARFRGLARGHAVRGAATATDPDEPEIAELVRTSGAQSVLRFQPFDPAPSEAHDGVVARAALEAVPEDDVPWILDEMFRSARRFVFARIAETPPPDSPNASARSARAARRSRAEVGPRQDTSVVTPSARWPDHFEAASRRHPSVHWELIVDGAEGPTCQRGGRFVGNGPPAVWVLEDGREASPDPALAVASALGWPWERRRAEGAGPPWPDLVLTSGSRAAAAARLIRERALGRTRVVQIGADAGARACDFDLVVTPLSAGYYPHPNRFETLVPVAGSAAAAAEKTARSWRERFESAASPRIALLVGDTRGVPAASLRRLATDATALAREAGGSLFVVHRDALPGPAAAALLGARSAVRRGLEPGDAVTRAHLELADAFVVAGDAEELLAGVCASGKPVTLYPLPARRRLREAVRRAVASIARAGRGNDRGTVRPQQGLERLCARLIDRGVVRPPRQPQRMHAALTYYGAAHLHGHPIPSSGFRPLREAERVAARVRALLGAV
jgi:mitochondrial fission protein ELM1